MDNLVPDSVTSNADQTPNSHTNQSPGKEFLNKGGIKVKSGTWKRICQIKISATGTTLNLDSTPTETWISMSTT
jgi:hypothetical protein